MNDSEIYNNAGKPIETGTNSYIWKNGLLPELNKIAELSQIEYDDFFTKTTSKNISDDKHECYVDVDSKTVRIADKNSHAVTNENIKDYMNSPHGVFIIMVTQENKPIAACIFSYLSTENNLVLDALGANEKGVGKIILEFVIAIGRLVHAKNIETDASATKLRNKETGKYTSLRQYYYENFGFIVDTRDLGDNHRLQLFNDGRPKSVLEPYHMTLPL